MTTAGPRRVEVFDRAGVVAASTEASRVAELLGFSPEESGEVAIVVSELASNLVRHAHGGTIALAAADWGGRPGVEIVAEDDGPGIEDVSQALADGVSRLGGLGTGLGTVNRLTDDLDIRSEPGRGTRITCYRWLRPPAPPDTRSWFDAGVATRSRRAAPENGDSFVVRSWPGHVLVAVIDGLGHGEPARQASRRARAFIESHADVPLATMFRGTGRACLSTRGVVMAVARIDEAAATVEVAAVGDVEARLLSRSDHVHFPIRRGIVGLNAPEARVTTHAWADTSVLVVHSDGLSTRWTWSDFPGTTWADASAAAQLMLRRLGKEDDDATVVVVRGRPDGD